MNTTSPSLKSQWFCLLALSAGHFVMDCFPGLMHTVLPAFQDSFQLTLAGGATLLTVFLVAANGIQVLTGHMRSSQDKPLLLYIGLVLSCLILLFGLVPSGSHALLGLCLIGLFAGLGVGLTHPESLRAIHRLDGISSAVSSSVFMAGGVIGFAVGGWGGPYLYQWWGIMGLIPFCIASLITLAVLMLLKVRLAVDKDEAARQVHHTTVEQLPFWPIMALATFAACSSQVLPWILPQYINHIGGDLTAGGLAVSTFSLAGGVGSIVFSRMASRKGELKLIIWMQAIGIPFIIAYLFLVRYLWSVGVLFVGGFFCFGTYPLMVSAARHCKGPNLGRRMGLMVGGIWLVACLLPMLLGQAAEGASTVPILFCVPAGFVLSLLLAIRTQSQCRKTLSQEKRP